MKIVDRQKAIDILKARSKLHANGCIEWIRRKDRYGYGLIELEGKTRLAHRVSYEIAKGDISEGMQLDHLCRKRACINPEHLEPVTNKENALRGTAPAILLHHSGKCAAGHEISGANLYVSPSGRRHCRACNRAAVARYNRRKRAA
jgi:hypothetical protein